MLFVGAYALTFFGEEKVSSLVLLAIIAQFTFLLIPNLKYVWFQGTNIDQHMQYGLANYVHTNGYVAPLGPINEVYSSTPFIHLAFAGFSSNSGMKRKCEKNECKSLRTSI